MAQGTLDISHDAVMEQRAKDAVTLPASPEMLQRVEEIMKKMESPEWKAQQQQMKGRVSEALGITTPPTKQEPNTPAQANIPRGILYVFISHSVPLQTLRNYVHDIEGVNNVVLVLRGFVGAATTLGPSAQFIHEILKKDTSCAGPECDTYNVEVDLDPVPFARYDIQRVPAIAYDRDVKELGHCDDPDARPGAVTRRSLATVYGDTSLLSAVEALERLSHETDLKYFNKKLRGGS